MASSKQNFLGLVKIEGIQTNYYNNLNKEGKLVFAHLWDSEDKGAKVNERFIINANNVEYKIATEDIFNALKERVAALEAWKPDVDSSIDRLDSSVSTLESLLADYSEWKDSVDASINNLQDKDIEIDSSIGDISTRLSKSLKSAKIASEEAVDNSTLIRLTTTDNDGTDSSTTVKVSGEKYVNVTGIENNITLSVTTASVETAAEGEGLADAKDVRDYIGEVLKDLEGALVFQGGIHDESEIPVDPSKGDTYVAQGTFDLGDTSVENGDLLIYGDGKWVVVERNLDGAVTANDVLDSSKLVVGANDDQSVKTIDITVDDLTTAIANANSAVQGVNVASDQDPYVTISVKEDTDTSIVDVSAIVSVIDVSTATTVGEGLADAKQVKDYVDWKVDSIPEVEMTLDSSTPAYVTTSATVSDGAINASVGVITATLADASNGSIGLAMAKDVYDELSKVEEVMATSVTTMKDTLGLDNSLGVNWDPNSGIAADSTYKAAIEGAYKAAHEAVVTSFAGKTGDISLATASQTAGDINLTISDGSVLSAAIVDLSTYVATAIDSSIKLLDVDSTEVDNKVLVGVSETDGKVDSSAVALVINGQAFTHAVGDPSMTVTISGLDISVSDIDTSTIAERIEAINVSVNALEDATYVRSVTGEDGIAERANDEYVAVSATTDEQTGAVTLDSSVKLAVDASLTSNTNAPTGLATDGWVKDFLAWEVIGDDVEPEP